MPITIVFHTIILYHIMMHRPLLTIASLVSLAAMPLTAQAYLTPDEVLYEDDFSARFYDPPPSPREVDAIAEQQRINSAKRREAELAALNADDDEDETMRAAAPDEETSEETGGSAGDLDALLDALERLQAIQGNTNATAGADADVLRDAEEERLLRRLRDREEAEARAAWLNSFGGETLHSGAPLSETGPASVLVTLAAAGAIGETWRRVRKADHV